jgi:hypothetical protein
VRSPTAGRTPNSFSSQCRGHVPNSCSLFGNSRAPMGPTTALLPLRPRASCHLSRMLISRSNNHNRTSPTDHSILTLLVSSARVHLFQCSGSITIRTQYDEWMGTSLYPCSMFIHGATSAPDAIVSLVPKKVRKIGKLVIQENISYAVYSFLFF